MAEVPATQNRAPEGGDAPGMHGCLKGCLWLLAIGVILLIAFAIVVIVCEPTDDPPPDLRGMQVAPRYVEPEDNAFPLLDRTAAAYAAIEGEPLQIVLSAQPDWQTLPEVIDSIRETGADDEDALLVALEELAAASGDADSEEDLRAAQDLAWQHGAERLEPILTGFDDALTREQLALPSSTYDLDTDDASVWSISSLGDLALAHARHLHRAGEVEAALARCQQVVRLGGLLEQGRGPLFHQLMAAAIKGSGLDVLREVTEEGECGPELLIEAAATLEEQGACVGCIQDALRQEFQFQKRILDQIARGELEGLGMNENIAFQHAAASGYLFLPNRTERRLAEWMSALIADLELPGEQVAERELPLATVQSAWDAFAMLPSGNVVGEILFAILAPSLESVAANMRELDIRLALTRIMLAVRAYEAREERLPATLTELVPDCLPAIPADPWDGAPMRYSAEEGRIWSAAADQQPPPLRAEEYSLTLKAE